jgi:glycerol-3-phosphate dehydrogenase subunit C
VWSLFNILLNRYVEEGYEIVTPVASCSLMLKKEWPLLFGNKDENNDYENVITIAAKTFDISEYVVNLAKEGKLDLTNLKPLQGIVTLHHACHARAQAMGFKVSFLHHSLLLVSL